MSKINNSEKLIDSLNLCVVKENCYIRTPEEAFNECLDLKNLPQECFVSFALNSRNKMIERRIVSIGAVNQTLAQPREIFRSAIIKNAVAIIVAHNHPSGDTTPSVEDIKITKNLISAGQIVGIKVLDHIIVGDTKLSFREAGIAEFD